MHVKAEVLVYSLKQGEGPVFQPDVSHSGTFVVANHNAVGTLHPVATGLNLSDDASPRSARAAYAVHQNRQRFLMSNKEALMLLTEDDQ